jgi:Ca2+-binding EF-hand superfamily protein
MRATTMMMLAAALVLARTASGGDPDSRKYDPHAAFAETDVNKDGVIDHAEFQERMNYIFFAADGNKDGHLDVAELKQLTFPEDFTDNDKDKNGRVSMREFVRVRFHDFTVADKDDDGVLSEQEIVDAFEGRRSR